MPMRSNVVLFGTDLVLINTREILLARAGIPTQNCSLLIVCSSVAPQQAFDALIAAHASEGCVKRLLGTSEIAIKSDHGVEVVSGLAGPEAFVDSIRRLLDTTDAD
jgi:hypothetical protein